MRWGIVAGLVVAFAVAAAHAEEEPQAKPKIGREMTLEAKDGTLYVVRGRTRASVPTDLSVGELYGATVKDGNVVAEYEDTNCQTPNEQTYTVDHLEARIYNARGLALHKKKKYAKAARQLAKANKLDPDFRDVATSYARALSKAGKPKRAAAALTYWLKKDPLFVYDKVMTDPDFGALRDDAKITGLRAKDPGAAVIAANGKIGGKSMAAYSKEKRLLAFLWDEAEDWDGCSTTRHLVVTPVGKPGDRFMVAIGGEQQSGSEPDVCDKFETYDLTRANRILEDFGFKRSWAIEGAIDSGKAVFKKTKLELSYESEAVKVLRDKQVVAEITGEFYMHLTEAYYVPAARVVVYIVTGAAADCAAADPQAIHLVKVPKK